MKTLWKTFPATNILGKDANVERILSLQGTKANNKIKANKAE